MLYLKQNNTFSPWFGEVIDGIKYPQNIEDLWTAQELADINLYQPLDADAIPEGKRVVSTSVEEVNGVVKFVHVLEDKPVIDWDQVDLDELNSILVEEGSILRALAILTFEQINALRTKANMTTFTPQQFKDALKAKMRG